MPPRDLAARLVLLVRASLIAFVSMLGACGSGSTPASIDASRPVGDGSPADATLAAHDATLAAHDATLAAHDATRDSASDAANPPSVRCDLAPIAPPASLGLDSFYKKYIDVAGVPVVGSALVRDAAFEPACLIMVHLLQRIPEARAELIALRVRVGIMAEAEVTTDMPEHSDLNEVWPSTDWDTRARGLGATIARPLSSVGEENLLGLPSDVYTGESIMVHEFAHSLFNLGIARTAQGSTHVASLNQLYTDAIAGGLWANTYAATNANEYWAESVQSWFGVNIQAEPTNGIHNHVDTRAELQLYDPDMATFVATFFVAEDAP